MDGKAVLATPMDQMNDAGASTVREYLTELLTALWDKGEAFSGKRPFGNSSWKYEIYIALVEAGIVDGEIDREDGYYDLVDFDEHTADQAVLAAIEELRRPPLPEPPQKENG